MGFATADMAAAIDATVGNFMNMNGLPGGAVAITYKDHLIFAKSYGYVDVGNALFAEPDSRFRLASVSKAITAMGILKLAHDRQLSLNHKPFPFSGVGPVIGGAYNSALSPPSGPTVDEMLHHAGGWDRDTGPDLMGYDTLHSKEGLIPNSSAPPDCTNLLRYVESQPLQFTPGTRVDYSNVGFCALSEVIRETSGASYIDYLQKSVLSPLGMNDTTLVSTQQSEQQDRVRSLGSRLPSVFKRASICPIVYNVLESYKKLIGYPSHQGQLRHPQNGDHPEVVRQAATVPCPLHAHLRLLDQPGRAMVRRTHQQADSPRRISQRQGTGSRYPPIH